MIWIGTSGFQYPEWKGTFYPEKFSTKKMLSFYAEHFSTTEINYTFYRIPSPTTLESWSAETPKKFRFTLKAPKQITHVLRLRNCSDVLRPFWGAALQLDEKLGAILFQLPPFMKKDVALLKDFLATLPPEMKSTFEFRHASWFTDEVFDCLKEQRSALCIADSEKLSTPVVMTADFAYFRLRDEGYAKSDIKRWADAVAAESSKRRELYVYFKHEESGSGPEFSRQMMEMLKIKKPRE